MINLKKTNIYKHRKHFLWKFIKENQKILDIGNIGFLNAGRCKFVCWFYVDTGWLGNYEYYMYSSRFTGNFYDF